MCLMRATARRVLAFRSFPSPEVTGKRKARRTVRPIFQARIIATFDVTQATPHLPQQEQLSTTTRAHITKSEISSS